MRGNNTNNVVVIADDDLFIRKVLQSALSGLAQVIEVTDGAAVEKTCLDCTPDLIFMDIHLPNISGMDLIHTLMRKDQGVFIIMLSADSSENNVRNSRLRGAKGFITKPFTKDRILYYFHKCPTVRLAEQLQEQRNFASG